MDAWIIFGLLFFLVIIQYIAMILTDRARVSKIPSDLKGGAWGMKEGFEGGSIPKSMAADSTIRWIPNKEVYDSFYASVYDQLAQGTVRNQAEVTLLLHDWTKGGGPAKESIRVLDVGCGTGVAVAAFAKLDVAKVIGLDLSKDMLQRAETVTIPSSTLTDKQKGVIEWREKDMMNPSALAGGEVTHACILYFTVYYTADKESLFRNLFVWVAPGGRLAIQVVNKHKFDPMLDSAAPWLAFSLQKYSKERITRSEVTFDKFTYVGEFDLLDPESEFRETFTFKDGTVRRHRHTLRMENMEEIVSLAKLAGWEYLGYTDLTAIGFEYSYHLNFKHP
jgi:SAM-dependent methyltransferase